MNQHTLAELPKKFEVSPSDSESDKKLNPTTTPCIQEKVPSNHQNPYLYEDGDILGRS